jgi:hypothetical protein
MRVLSLDDVEKMAEAVVAEHLGAQVPLAASLSKKATAEGLNPDQVTNLVQLANVLTHLKLFDQKNDGDKIVDFEPINPDSVLKQVYSNTDPSSGASEKEIVMEGNSPSSDPVNKAMDFFGDLPCCQGDSDGGASNISGLVDGGGSESGDSGNRSPRSQSISIIQIRKVAEDLRDRREAVAVDYRDELEKLASDFAQLYSPDLEEFEKNASQVYGVPATEVLSTLRTRLRLPAVRYSMTKTASVIDTDTPQFKSLQKLMKLAADFGELVEADSFMQEKFGGVL